ncbi:hypothetical protein GOQ04_14740 [Emticicia sp. ODNR4P]|nr:hypothetical protein [Emticicia sp. ODNR4P]
MKRELYQAGVVAIPLKVKAESNLNPHPNYIVFDNVFGKIKAESPNIQTGNVEVVDCMQTVYKIVYREVLEETVNKPEEFIERTLLPQENLAIPAMMVPVIFTHQSIKENLAIVNLALSRFSFRGVLSNLVLEVDETVLDEIIAQENDPQ